MTGSMWKDAMLSLEAQLECPHCHELNSPTVATNQIHAVDARGMFSCSTCGRGGPVQDFIPDHLGERLKERR